MYNTLNTKLNNLEQRIPAASALIQKNQYNTDKQNVEKKTGDVENKILDIRYLASTAALNEVENKIPDVSGFASTTLLNTKIDEVENKIPNVSGLVKKTYYGTKIKGIEGKYFTTSDYNKFTCDILDSKVKQKKIGQ